MGTVRIKLLGAAVLFYCLWLLQAYVDVLEFDRQQILSGEIWRLWTGHLVHTNSTHFLVNVVAAIIIYFGFFAGVKLFELLWCSIVFAALISVALLVFYPSLAWYNGLSGLLHALVSYFLIRLALNENKLFWLGLAIVWVKVLVETLRAYVGYEGLIGDMTVITEAHLVGVFFGTAIGIIRMVLLRVKDRFDSKLIVL